MAELTEKKRDSLKASQFGLPDEKKYPMPDKAHARNAKARASQQKKKGISRRARRPRSTARPTESSTSSRCGAQAAPPEGYWRPTSCPGRRRMPAESTDRFRRRVLAGETLFGLFLDLRRRLPRSCAARPATTGADRPRARLRYGGRPAGDADGRRVDRRRGDGPAAVRRADADRASARPRRDRGHGPAHRSRRRGARGGDVPALPAGRRPRRRAPDPRRGPGHRRPRRCRADQ